MDRIKRLERQPEGGRRANKGVVAVGPAPLPAGMRPWSTLSKVIPSGILGSTVSELDTITSKFSQAVIVEDDEAFTLKPIILTDSSLAGRRVLMLVKNVTFLDLPGELRNQIWEQVVLERGVTFTHGVSHVRRLHLRLSPTTVSLVQVSKDVSAEVRAIVYGSNTFLFGSFKTFHDFATHIGPVARSHLRHIGIMNASGPSFPPQADLRSAVSDMTALRSLTINHETIYLNGLPGWGKVRIGDFFKALKPLLYALCAAARTSSGSAAAALDLVKLIKHDFCGDCGTKMADDSTECHLCSTVVSRIEHSGQKHLKKVSDEWRKMVAEEFGLTV